MKLKIPALLVLIALSCNANAQSYTVHLFKGNHNPWNAYIGIPWGAAKKTITIIDGYVNPYTVGTYKPTGGISLTLEKESDEVNIIAGFTFMYLTGSVVKDDNYYNQMPLIVDNPDKNLSQLTALFNMEINLFRPRRLHFSLPFGMGFSRIHADDEARLGLSLNLCARLSYFVNETMAAYVKAGLMPSRAA